MSDLEWSAFTIRLSFLIFGVLLGTLLGWQARTMKYARDAGRETHQMHDELHEHDRDETGAFGWRDAALLIAVMATAAAAVVSGYSAAEVGRTADCTETILGQTVEALNQRSALTNESADQQQEVLHAQVQLLRITRQPGVTPAEQAAAFDRYFWAIRRTDKLAQLNRQKRESFPFPTQSDIKTCIRGED